MAVKRILLMDDSPIFLEVAAAALREAGYDVICACDLRDLSQARGEAPDLVLMDVQMPEAFGDDIALSLRNAHGIAVPIYLLSSLDELDLADRVKWAQIDGFISKNQGIKAVVGKVKRILADERPG